MSALPMPTRLAFVHGATSAAADVVVALTPLAYEACTRLGGDPLVLDDFVARPDFFGQTLPYDRWQREWLLRLDQLAGGSGLVPACAQLIKVPVDSVVAASRLLGAALDAIAPSEVVYVGETRSHGGPWHAGHLQFHPLLGDVPLAASLLPELCQARGLALEIQRIESTPSTPMLWSRLRSELASTLGPLRRRSPAAPLGDSRAALMLWHAGYGAEEYRQALLREGISVHFLTRGGRVARVVDSNGRGLRGISKPVNVRLRSPGGPRPDALAILAEVDSWAGLVGAGALLEPRLRIFLDSVCPAVDAAARDLAPLLESRRIGQVAAANPSTIAEFAALRWAGAAGVERVLCQHGDHLFSYNFWLLTETQNFEHLRATDSTLAADLAAASAGLGTTGPRVTVDGPRLVADRARANAVRPARADAPVVYVPTFYMGDTYVVGASYIEDGWYHRWRRMLLQWMRHRTDIRFVWKTLPSGDQAKDPIADLLETSGSPNVRLEHRPFTEVLADAGRVITDFPSTALYESLRAGVPTLAITFPRFMTLRPSAEARFRQVLRSCADEAGALAAVDEFLATDSKRWVIDPDRSTLD